MPTQDELADAVAERLLQLMRENATSDTILKLAEAWAWIREPGQSHGSGTQG